MCWGSRTLNNGRTIRKVFNKPRFVSVCASNKPILAWQACPSFETVKMGVFTDQDGVEEPDAVVADSDIFGSVGTVDASDLARDEAGSVSERTTCTSLNGFTRCRFVSETL